MQENLEFQKSDALANERQREEAMAWIGKLLETIGVSQNIRIANWNWQIESGNSYCIDYQLVVLGFHNKRAIKVFTATELDRCTDDKELQAEIQLRLERLVAFLGTRVESRSSSAGKRK